MAVGTKRMEENRAPAQKSSGLSNEVIIPAVGLGLIILLAAFLRFYELGANSIGNTYYAATVKSMLTSWHNFFFGAFEPGGSVTVDKPPLGFWVQAILAYFLGISGFALALPQALAGVLSIPVLYTLVKRHFGVWSGLTAALVLAIVPVTVATERNNTIDGLLVFVLLLAAWAFIKAIESGKLRHLLLGAFLVGMGFNIKMLQAFMPLPAFYALYFIGARHPWWKRILHLGAASVVLLVVSLSWAVVVDLIPEESRPYIGSSQDNTVMELIIGHNGLSRLGLNNRGPGGDDRRPQDGGPNFGPPPDGGQALLAPRGAAPLPGDGVPSGQPFQFPKGIAPPPGNDQPGNFAGRLPAPSIGGQPGQFSPRDGQDGGGPRPGGGPGNGRSGEVGRPGVFRLFEEPLVTEASWLLPLVLMGIPLALVVVGWSRPLSDKHLGLLLWAGWLLPSMAYFSFTTGLFHRYYLIMLGPPLAALVGIALWAVIKLWKRNHWVGWVLILALTGITIAFEIFTFRNYLEYTGWVASISLVGWLMGAGLLAWRSRPRLVNLGAAMALAALLIAPLAWSALTTFNSNPNVALPTAGVGTDQRSTFMTPDKDMLGLNGEAILDFLIANTDPESYLLATLNARGAAPYILATGRPVLTFGGFTGSDNVVSVDDLIEMVEGGELRYILGLPQQKPDIASWMSQSCAVVEVPGLPQMKPINQPINSKGRNFPGGPQGKDEVLYDCGS